MAEPTKRCGHCKEVKSVEEFRKCRRWRFYLCKKCEAQYQKDYRKKNREQLSVYYKKWYEDNKEHVLQKCSEWAERNKNKRQVYCKRHGMKHKDRCKSSKLKYQYGISLEDYNQMFAEQGGVCAICKQPETIQNQYGIVRLAVDHDHITGAIRKLLCRRCNTVLGLVGENPDTFLAMIAYLRKYTHERANFSVDSLRFSA